MTIDEPGVDDGRPRPWLRPGFGVVLLMVSGAALAVLPHLLAWWRTGDARYIADSDGLLYLAWSRDAVRQGVGRITDAVHPQSGPMMHPWLIFVPPALLSHALGLGMTGVSILWRLLAGAGTALGLYAVVRPVVRDPRVAIGVALFLLFDPGLAYGQIVRRDVEILDALARGSGELFAGVARAMPHLRVVTPGLAIPFLLFHFGLVLRARLTGGTRPALLAAASFGLLFYVYFYFWTTVLVGAAIAFVLDPKGRRLYATILVGGLLIGAPAILSSRGIKASTPPDWLLRTDKFVPIGHLKELLIPKVLIAEWVVVGWFVFRRRPELRYFWCCSGAGLFCANQQIVTGLQIENSHWLLGQGLAFSVLLADLFAPWVFEGRERWRGVLLSVLVALQVAVGTWIRVLETERTAATRKWDRVARQVQEDGLDGLPGEVVAGDPDALLMIAAIGRAYPLAGWLVEFSSLVTDQEFDERLMLNDYLRGLSRAEARQRVDEPPHTLSWEGLAMRYPAVAAHQRARRHALIDVIWDDPGPWLRRFDVSRIVLETHSPTAHLAGLGRLEKSGRHWKIWRID